MKKLLTWLSSLMLVFAIHGPAIAADGGTPEEAVAMVKKAVAFIKANGKEKALAAFNDHKGPFVDRNLYIFAYDFKGTNLAIGNGNAEKMNGKNLSEMKDVDGVYLIKKFIEIANSKGSGWVDYRWPNPSNNVIEPKTSYVERVGDMVIGCGTYK
eukprot:gene22267-22239_t